MPRRPKMKQFPLLLDDATKRNLRERARMHGVTMSAFIRARINGHRPGAEPGTEAAMADAWWDRRSPARRVSIWKNHDKGAKDTNAADDAQLAFEETP